MAGCHPTGTPIVDPVETAVFAAGFTLLVARAARDTWLVTAIAAVLLARGWFVGLAAADLLVALMGRFLARTGPWAGAVVGALGVQVILRWPAHFFHGFTAAAAVALVVLCTISAWKRASRRTRQRAAVLVGGMVALAALCSVLLVVETLMVKTEALRGEASARSALVDAGNGSSRSVVTDLAMAALDTRNAARAVDSWVTVGSLLVPGVAQQQRFLAGTLRAASSAASVGRREASAIEPQLGSQPGRIDLGRVESLATPMRILDRQLHATDSELAGFGSSWIIGPLQARAASFRHQVTQATHNADLGVEATRVVPGMLGADGTRHYLIAFMTPSESRGYDGLIGSYGLLTAQQGHISLTASGNISNVQTALPKGGAQLTGVSEYLTRYGAFDVRSNPEDAMYSPDLPTDAKVFAQMYAQSIGGPIDGVLAIDPYGLAALLHFTGPIRVNGLPFPLTESNAARVLLTEEYTTFESGLTNNIQRHDVLQSVLQVAFDTLVSRALPPPRELSAVLAPAAETGRISLWSFHQNEQPFLSELGIDGAFPKVDGGDLLAVTTQNAGNNKIDAYLHTSIVDRVTFDPSTEAERSVVRVKLTNDAPASGLPPEVIDSSTAPPGTNKTWLSVYSPLSLDDVTVDGTPSTMSAARELGVWVYSTYVNIAPGTSATVRVALFGRVATGSTLRVSVRLQPSANPELAQVQVTSAGPWRLAAHSNLPDWSLGPAMLQERDFRFVTK